MYVAAREVYRSLANCFQNNNTVLVFKTRYIACKKKCDKAGIGFTFSKKFLDLEKKKNSKFNDAAVTKVALNSEVPSKLIFQESITIRRASNGLSPWFPLLKRLHVAIALPPICPRHTNQAGDAKLVVAQGVAEVAEGGLDKGQGTVVVDQEHNQAERTDAISAAGATTSTAIAPIRLTVEER